MACCQPKAVHATLVHCSEGNIGFFKFFDKREILTRIKSSTRLTFTNFDSKASENVLFNYTSKNLRHHCITTSVDSVVWISCRSLMLIFFLTCASVMAAEPKSREEEKYLSKARTVSMPANTFS